VQGSPEIWPSSSDESPAYAFTELAEKRYAEPSFDGDSLHFVAIDHWHNFVAFESMLAADGPWVTRMDFPFGQSRKFIENIGWPQTWSACVQHVGTMTKAEFRTMLDDYKRHRPSGDKQHKRTCDARARSQSPQTQYGVPVALMFFEGAPRLLSSGAHLPHHEVKGDLARTVVEAYPGLAARTLIGSRSYKNDSRKKQTPDRALARRDILALLCGPRGREHYGFTVDAPSALADDPGGDELDALLCAVQAAWATSIGLPSFGAPPDLDPLEGWIADPTLLD